MDIRTQYKRSFLVIFFLVPLLISWSAKSHGLPLWDQQPSSSSPSYLDQEFPDLQGFSTYLVNDVVFDSDVVITSVTTYFDRNDLWPIGTDVVPSVLNIFDGNPLTASDDPTGGGDFGIDQLLVDITIIPGSMVTVTADNLGIPLPAGSYYFGLTPILALNQYTQEGFHAGAGFVAGETTFARNPGGGFGVGTDWYDIGQTVGSEDWDMALTINGDITAVPEPATLLLLGSGLVGLVGLRKKVTG